jgi:hypothetical protein
MSSCLFEEENIFDESAAQRVNTAMEEDFNLLTSASNGWVLNYFPTSDKEGYTLLMNFNKDNTVTIAAKNNLTNNIYNSEVSLFEMIADNGPVLTFNSYNEYLHGFSVPDESHGGSQGKGLEGDYEFIIMETSPDRILLKGKKRGVKMDLRRLPENQDWKEYFTSIEQMNTLLFRTNKPNAIIMTIDDTIRYNLDNGISHIFAMLRTGGDALMDTKQIPFIVTDYGIKFAKPFSSESGKSVQTFKLSDDKNSLVCIDENLNAKIEGIMPMNLYTAMMNLNADMKFIHDSEDMSPSIKEVYDRISVAMADKGRKYYISMSNYKNQGQSLFINTTKGTSQTVGYLSFSIVQNNNSEIAFSFNGFNAQTDRNGKNFYDTYNGIADLVRLLEGTYTISYKGCYLNPSAIHFVSTSDNNKWFNLSVTD